MDVARTFLRDCAAAKLPTLILPDKDADGLCSGLILYCTLLALGLPPSLLSVHFVAKGSNVHSAEERAQIALFDARYVVLADQGSRPGPAIVNHPEAKALIVDHHLSNEFPNGAFVLSSAHHEPVATSSTLAYLLCRPLIPPTAPGNIMEKLEYLCVMGTMGDLGTSFKWEPPFPNMRACTKKWTKKVLGDAVSLLNAPRRCARYNVRAAWDALWDAPSPRALVSPSSPHAQRLYDARAEVRAEVERCTHTAPVFSGDGRVALVRISSGAQVHPLIATRWASTLKSARLEMVMCANSGYLPGVGVTNFACRVARCTLSRAKPKTRVQSADVGEDGINIIEMLKGYAARVPGLQEAMGEDFARGHKQASGGIVRTEQFERLWAAMLAAEPEVTEGKRPRKKLRAAEAPVQKNTLEGWIKKP
ncbi:DHH phosphoesterase [Wolfiporia cocos MD-104 SS10]|uniref:DHH phosphoesterase n=1 Tax=Wolfiporia cocos (strain MD-104) TaxID=742152 RepID=A0A2H3ISL6_WOLCO|nr:DHH phosphoesterase [Wolfiporia cocos MD-104 SS10]